MPQYLVELGPTATKTYCVRCRALLLKGLPRFKSYWARGRDYRCLECVTERLLEKAAGDIVRLF